MNILKLEKRGMDFLPADEISKVSDIGNHRLVTGDYTVPATNGKTYYIEFQHINKYQTRTKNKRTGKPLARPVRELVASNIVCMSACYEDADGNCWGDTSVWRASYDAPRPYTMAGILDCVNSFAAQPYDAIQLV